MRTAHVGFVLVGLAACTATLSQTGPDESRSADAGAIADAASDALGSNDALASCGPPRDAAASDSCLPVASLPDSGCPADWAGTPAAKFEFCAHNDGNPFGNYGAFRTKEPCGGWLRYSTSVFDSGPTYCLYDPVTQELAAYGRFDGKANYEAWTCGFSPHDFEQQTCTGTTCADLEAPDGGVCVPGAGTCTGDDRLFAQKCNAVGQWDTGTTCPHVCSHGSCIGACDPGARECALDTPRYCNGQGEWTLSSPCTHACGGGQCGSACDGGICPPVTLATGATQLAVDGKNVYWSARSSGPAYAIRKQPIAGGPPGELAQSEDVVNQISVDATDVYWAEGEVEHGALKRVPIAGGPVSTISTLSQAPNGISIDSTNAYSWFNGPEGFKYLDSGTPSTVDTITKSPLSGGVATTLVAAKARRIAVDSSRLYWTDGEAGDVRAIPLAAGSAFTIASNQKDPGGLVVAGSHVYWRTSSEVVAAPIGSCSPVTVLASNQDSSREQPLATDGERLYWTNFDAIMTVPLSGGTPTILASYQDQITAIAVDASYVYWIANGAVRRIAK